MGAALGTVGGACDLVFNLGPIRDMLMKEQGGEGEGEGGDLAARAEDRARIVALEKGREAARNEVIQRKG